MSTVRELLRAALFELALKLTCDPAAHEVELLATTSYILTINLDPSREGYRLLLPHQVTVALTEAERPLFEVCSSVPLTAKRIASLLDRPYNSNLRGILTSLCRKQALLHGPDGYARNPSCSVGG